MSCPFSFWDVGRRGKCDLLMMSVEFSRVIRRAYEQPA